MEENCPDDTTVQKAMFRGPVRPRASPALSARRQRPVPRRTLTAAAAAHREELSFALITPESLAKARTGGILARLLSSQGLRLVGARMLAPSRELHAKYVAILERASKEDGHVDCYEQALIDYVRYNLSEAQCLNAGIPHAAMFLLFSGHNARLKLSKIVGDNLPPPSDYGRTIRGTFGDYHQLDDGQVVDFHPAVLTPNTPTSNREALRLFAEYAESDGGVLSHSPHLETGLVLIKPDNLQRASSLPGHIIDLFGTLGLQIVGVKLFSMTLNQGKHFYGFLEDIFVEKLSKRIEGTLRDRLMHAFDFPISDAEYAAMAAVLKKTNARFEVAKIISYMTGVPPYSGVADGNAPGPARCLGLLYRGENTIAKIREKLGATDPSKAAEGTIRSDFGHDLMRNGAHASDSVANAERERRIVGMMGTEPSAERALIEAWLSETEAFKHEFK